ncbi:MAG: hypothetical protein ACFB21_12580 [Opitutales bacterium]
MKGVNGTTAWLLLALGAGGGGLACVLLGMLVPVFYGSIDLRVLEALPSGVTVQDRADALASRGEVALARRMHRAGGLLAPDSVARPALPVAAEVALAAGGPAPLWLDTVEIPEGLRLDAEAFWADGPAVALSFLTRPSDRARLADFVANSQSPVVATLDAAARSAGWVRFQAVGTGAEAPLLVASGLTALLAESGAWPEPVESRLVELAIAARGGEVEAVAQLEPFFLATLGLARELSFAELRALASTIDSLGEWPALRELLLRPAGTTDALSEEPDRWSTRVPDVRLAAVVAMDDASPVLEFFDTRPSRADEALAVALLAGQPALKRLLAADHPLRIGPQWAPLDALFTELAPYERFQGLTAAFAGLAAEHPSGAWVVKWALLAFGGGLLVLAVGGPGLLAGTSFKVALIRLLAPGLLLAIVGQLLLEPELLRRAVDESAKLRLDFTATMLQTETTVVPTFNLDQTTLLVLVGFFALQLLLYGLSLMKLSQVQRMSVPAAVKLRLLDNEEHLFDAGLYVGLAGTVISLLLLAAGMMDAILPAAYSSTLFGIIFVAVLKIFHLRPLRARLVLDTKPKAASKPTPGAVPALSENPEAVSFDEA